MALHPASTHSARRPRRRCRGRFAGFGFFSAFLHRAARWAGFLLARVAAGVSAGNDSLSAAATAGRTDGAEEYLFCSNHRSRLVGAHNFMHRLSLSANARPPPSFLARFVFDRAAVGHAMPTSREQTYFSSFLLPPNLARCEAKMALPFPALELVDCWKWDVFSRSQSPAGNSKHLLFNPPVHTGVLFDFFGRRGESLLFNENFFAGASIPTMGKRKLGAQRVRRLLLLRFRFFPVSQRCVQTYSIRFRRVVIRNYVDEIISLRLQ